MKKRTLLLVVFIFINVLITGCNVDLNSLLGENSGNDYSFLNNDIDDILDTGPVKSGVLNLFSTAPDTLNPILTANAFVKDYSCFIYESLVKLNDKQKPVPVLAERWEPSEGGKVWTFYLRDNVYWHDNIRLSAEDVEFTASTIVNAGSKSPYASSFKNVVSFSAVDSKTFRVEMDGPNSFTPELMTFPIIPKHYYLGEDIMNTPKNDRPIGTGPYRFVEYRENEFIRLEDNESWWKNSDTDESGLTLPYITEINIKIYGKDSSVTNAFQSREVDMIIADTKNWIGYSGRSDITLKKYVSNRFEFIAFNLSNKILKEKEVRKAIAYAVDRSKLVNDVMPGEAVVSDLPVIPDTWLYDTNIVSYERDVEKAKQILNDSGWTERNGVLYKRINGVNTSLTLELLVNTDNERRLEVAKEIQGQLQEVGIALNIKEVTWEDELNKVKSGKFDMAFVGCNVPSIPDISFLYSSAEIGTGINIAGYENEIVDSYLSMILRETDSSMKKAYFINMKEAIYEDMPYLGLYFFYDAAIYNKRIRGEFNPCIWSKYDNFAKWYIPDVE